MVAEKFQAMVYLGALDRRMKDFYDVWLFASHFAFGGAVLAKAIAATFKNRETAIDVVPIPFTQDFTEQASPRAQWTAFRKKLPNTECPENLSEVVAFLAGFLLPIAGAYERGDSFEQRWPPGGPWTTGLRSNSRFKDRAACSIESLPRTPLALSVRHGPGSVVVVISASIAAPSCAVAHDVPALK